MTDREMLRTAAESAVLLGSDICVARVSTVLALLGDAKATCPSCGSDHVFTGCGKTPAEAVIDWLDRFAVNIRFAMDDDAPCEIDYCDTDGNEYRSRGSTLAAAVLAAKSAPKLLNARV